MAEYLQGTTEFLANLAQKPRDTKRDAAARLHQITLDVIEDARENCPVKSGALKNTGEAHEVVISDDQISNTMSFGDGGVVNYATYVHEDLTAKHPGGGRAKFLERAILRLAGNYDSEIAKGIKF